MVDMNDFEDIEARLRRFQPVKPPAELRATVLEAAARIPQRMPRPRLWRYAAAAVLVVALDLGTDHYLSVRIDLGAPVRQESALTENGMELLKSLNGAGWPTLALYVSAGPRRPAWWLQERQRLLRELTQ